MSTAEPITTTDDDFSAASTTITFDRPLPLLRGPTRPARPHHGPYVLAFRDPKAWSGAYRACEAKLLQQCEAGSRIGCALSAADACKPPWWKLIFGGKGIDEMKERAACEERETERCVAAAKERCVGFAREKCVGPFREARVCGMGRKEAAEMVGWVAVMEKSRWVGLVGLEKCGFGATNCRAGEMVGCCDEVDRVLGRRD